MVVRDESGGWSRVYAEHVSLAVLILPLITVMP